MGDKVPELSPELQTVIAQHRYFAGGLRHQQLLAEHLPKGHHWEIISVPLRALFEAMSEGDKDWLVFASGDPLFYGIGVTLRREFPQAQVKTYPYFNSLQLLAHRFALPYGDYQTITLTGRDFHRFDAALMQGVAKMGVLTDRKNTPKSIAQRMLDYGYANYTMYYGEKLGGEQERCLKLQLEEAIALDFKHPNCFYLEKRDNHRPKKGLLETDFEPLEGRPKMITKMPIRLATLALMNLQNASVFWDVGACTGSVSIEARLHYPHLRVCAFEIRPESAGIISRNAQHFQCPGIDLSIGDFLQVDKAEKPRPDAVFIGGYGGQMAQILNEVDHYLEAAGTLAFNSVSEKSEKAFKSWCRQNHYALERVSTLQVDDHNPITILVSKKNEKQ